MVVVCNCTRNRTSDDRIVAEQDALSRLRIRTAQLEIKILAKRRNIESLGQIFRDDESGRPNGNQDPRNKTEHRINGTDLPGRRIRTTQSEIKILAKRRNIESLGQIFRDNKSGRPNQKSRSSQKDETSHDWDRSSGATNQDD